MHDYPDDVFRHHVQFERWRDDTRFSAHRAITAHLIASGGDSGCGRFGDFTAHGLYDFRLWGAGCTCRGVAWATHLVTTGDRLLLVSGYQAQLIHAFDFTSEDLQANQQGRMTSRQQAQVKPSIGDYLQKVGLTVLVTLIGIVLGSVESLLNPDPILDIGWDNIVIASGIITIIAVIVLRRLFRCHG